MIGERHIHLEFRNKRTFSGKEPSVLTSDGLGKPVASTERTISLIEDSPKSPKPMVAACDKADTWCKFVHLNAFPGHDCG